MRNASLSVQNLEYSTRILLYLDDEDVELAASSEGVFCHNLNRERLPVVEHILSFRLFSFIGEGSWYRVLVLGTIAIGGFLDIPNLPGHGMIL